MWASKGANNAGLKLKVLFLFVFFLWEFIGHYISYCFISDPKNQYQPGPKTRNRVASPDYMLNNYKISSI